MLLVRAIFCDDYRTPCNAAVSHFINLSYPLNMEMFMSRCNTFATFIFAAVLATTIASSPASAQNLPDAASLIATQKAALEKFSRMDGVWRGPAWTILPSGEKHNITQTERIGPLLDGSIKLVEGRGYEPDGRVSFSAFGVISYNPESKNYRIRSHA